MGFAPAIITALAQAAPAAQQAGDDRQWMVYAVIAFGMALALLVLEAFVPSGGILGVLAGIAAVAGIILFFRFDTMWGMVATAVTLLSLPFVVGGLMWIAPNTPIGRALTLRGSQARVNAEGPPADPADPSAIVVGMEGEALTGLRPVGSCRLGGRRIDCMALSGVIEPGAKVRVVRVEGLTVKVRAV